MFACTCLSCGCYRGVNAFSHILDAAIGRRVFTCVGFRRTLARLFARCVSSGGAFGIIRVRKATAFESLVCGKGGVKLKITFAGFADDNANLVVADFDNIRFGHALLSPGGCQGPFKFCF